jgi:REP element-mobilizing transposase RayT
MPYNPTIHNRRSIRLQGFDYSETGSYFITICTYKKEHLFGEIVNSEMKLNLLGQFAYNQWKQIPQRFENVELNEFVIMPNHIHGIIVIVSGRGEGLENSHNFPPKSTFSNPSPLQDHSTSRFNGTVPGSIGAIIQNFKSGTSRKINAMPDMKNVKIWQINYYDHIIRDREDYDRIVEYIRDNPSNWEKDELY